MKVEMSQIDQLKSKMKSQHCFASALSGKGVEEAFTTIAENILKNVGKRKNQNDINTIKTLTPDGIDEKSCC